MCATYIDYIADFGIRLPDDLLMTPVGANTPYLRFVTAQKQKRSDNRAHKPENYQLN